MAPRRDCCTAQIERQGRACASIKGMSDCRGPSMSYSRRRTLLTQCSLASPTWLFIAAPVMVLALGAGCGGSSDTAHIQGTITIDGQPLPEDAEGSVSFQSTAPGPVRAAAAKIVNGRFDSPQTPRGPVKAFISLSQPTGRMLDNARGQPSPEYKSLVPPQYASGVELEITGDKSDLTLNLKPS
jgi:hypothetical protein